MVNGFEFTVGLVNFVLLLFLLKIFMFDPLKVVAREREEKARRDMEEASGILSQAGAHRERYQGLLAGLEQEKAGLVEAAHCDARQLRQRLAEEAEKEALQILARARLEVEAQHQAARAGLRARAAQATVARAENLLKSGLDAGAQREILENFVARVGGADA